MHQEMQKKGGEEKEMIAQGRKKNKKRARKEGEKKKESYVLDGKSVQRTDDFCLIHNKQMRKEIERRLEGDPLQQVIPDADDILDIFRSNGHWAHVSLAQSIHFYAEVFISKNPMKICPIMRTRTAVMLGWGMQSGMLEVYTRTFAYYNEKILRLPIAAIAHNLLAAATTLKFVDVDTGPGVILDIPYFMDNDNHMEVMMIRSFAKQVEKMNSSEPAIFMSRQEAQVILKYAKLGIKEQKNRREKKQVKASKVVADQQLDLVTK